MKLFLRSLVLTLFAITLTSANVFSQSATITTDQPDYPPGSTVIITGTGFQPGETVTLQVLHDPTGGDDATDPSHLPWTVVADGSGNFSSTWTVPSDADELGATLKLTADGQSSGLHAEVVFTDGTRTLDHITVGAQSSSIIYGSSGSPTFLITVSTTVSGGGTSNLNSITFSASGLPSGVTVTSFTPASVNASNTTPSPTSSLELSVPNNLNAGSYNFTVTASGGTGNNARTVNATGTLTITTKAASVTPNPGTKVYGNADPALTGSTSGFLAGDNVVASYSRVTGETVTGSPYIISAALSPAGVLSNYNITYNTANFTITARPITITPNAGQSKVYGNADPAFTYTASEALQSGNSYSGALGRTAGNNVGTYTYTLGTLSAGSNYSLTLGGSNTFAITARPITITPNAGQSKVYGNADPTFTYTASEALQSGDSYSGALGRASGESVASSPYTYTIGTLSAGTNYTLTLGGSNTFAITARPITVTPDALSKVYGNTDPTFTYAPSEALLTGNSFSGALSRATGESVASSPYAYTIGTLSAGSNYTVTINPANTNKFSITARPITVTPDALSKVYGNTDPTFTYTPSEALLTGNSFSGTLSRAPGESVAGSPYAYTMGTLSAGSNYSLTLGGSNTFAITARPITITPNAGQSKVYGNADPTFTYTASEALQSGNSYSGALGRVLGESVAGSPYAYTLGTLSAGSNYSLTLGGSNTFTITARPITITPNAGQSKVYGNADPTFTYTASEALQSGNSYSGALGRVLGESVAGSPYAYTMGTLSAGSNYSLTLGGSNTFTITARPITITPNAGQSKVYGNADPTFTYTASEALQSGNSYSGALGRAPGESVAGSPYAYTLGTLSAGNNYSLSLGGSNTFAITARPITITPNAGQSKVYGNADPTFTYTASEALQSGNSYSGALGRAPGESVAGSPYAYTLGTLSAGNNYSLSLGGSNTFAITARPITITPNAGQSKVYGNADPTFTYTASEALQSGDSYSGALGRASGESVAGSPYAYTLGTLSAGTNYSLTLGGSNTFAITARPITITPDLGQFKYCGQSDPTFTYTSSEALLPGNSFSGPLGRSGDANSGNGIYNYTLGTLSAGNNYILTLGGSNTFEIKGVSIDASNTSTAIQLATPTKILTATVSSGSVLVPNATVTFTITNNGNINPITVTAVTDVNGVATSNLPSGSLAVGLYQVTALAGSGCAQSVAYFSVYDPNAGFVTGGGWINSPAGAYRADTTLIGKANFGFNAQYKKGSQTPDGNTEFQFQAGNLNFKSTYYTAGSLVIAGAKAIFQGTGTINGTGSYNFMISAIDGSISGGGGVDKFRIKIWTNANGSGVVYDNNQNASNNADPTTTLGGGSIVIHSSSTKSRVMNTVSPGSNVSITNNQNSIGTNDLEGNGKLSIKVMPNPTSYYFTLILKSLSKENVKLTVTDITGRVIEQKTGVAANSSIQLGNQYHPGIYIAEFIQGNDRITLRLIKEGK
jgi:hypothetical protein